MIRLSPEQVLALQNEAMHSFASRVVDELPGYRAPLTDGRSRRTLFRATTAAIERAQSFEIETERALFLYVNLAVTLGAAFDSDPALPWATDILSDASYLDGSERIDDLWNSYMDYCDAVIGAAPEDAAFFPAHAYRALAQRPPAPRLEGTSLSPAVADFRRIWPEKADILSRDALRVMIREMDRRAQHTGLTDIEARLRFGQIGFVLGYAWDADPMHDWAWPILHRAGTGLRDAEVMNALEDGLDTHVLTPALTWRKEDESDPQPAPGAPDLTESA